MPTVSPRRFVLRRVIIRSGWMLCVAWAACAATTYAATDDPADPKPDTPDAVKLTPAEKKAHAETIREHVRQRIIQYASDVGDVSFDIKLFGRISNVKLESASDDGLEVIYDDEILDIDWDDVGDTTLAMLLLNVGGNGIDPTDRARAGILVRFGGDADAGNYIITKAIRIAQSTGDKRTLDTINALRESVFGKSREWKLELKDLPPPKKSGKTQAKPTLYKGIEVFPPDNWWNTPIDTLPVLPNSDAIIAAIGADRPIHPDFGPSSGMPITIVGSDQKKVPIKIRAAGESDPGPYPIPPDAPLEGLADRSKGSGDRHVIVIDKDKKLLYEMYGSYYVGPGWRCGSGAVFDLTSNALRPRGWTSADAAGLPIMPGLVKADEVLMDKEIRHAIRVTVRRTRRGFITPARHDATSRTDENLPVMGMRIRLKADFNIKRFPPEDQVILTALKKYGFIIADHGSPWYFQGETDDRWNMSRLVKLREVTGKEFEVVDSGKVQYHGRRR